MNKETATLLEEHFDTAFAEPASELLKEIEAEKQRLIKEKKSKSPNPCRPSSQRMFLTTCRRVGNG